MNLNFDDIYPDVHDIADTVHIEHISNATGRPVCIFGILESKQGLLIRDEMLSWLKLEYDVWCVYQKLPGRLFEYPALRFAQYMSIQDNIDWLLYVHTKGAANNSEIQKRIRTLWRHEFTGSRAKLYKMIMLMLCVRSVGRRKRHGTTACSSQNTHSSL